MANVIAFTGKKGVGKNFVAEIARRVLFEQLPMMGHGQEHRLNIEFAAFADPMKDFLVNIVGLDRLKIYGDDNDKDSPTVYRWENMPSWLREKFKIYEGYLTIRHALQIFGTELNREIWDQEIWVNFMQRRIKNSEANWVLVTDARYQNEIDSIHNVGGKIWRIDGPPRGAAKKDMHSSEISMDKLTGIDYIIINSLEDNPETLKAKVIEGLQGCFNFGSK